MDIRQLLFSVCLSGLIFIAPAYAETITPKIVGGVPVITAPSWMVALWVDTDSDSGFCSGTLIDTQWIMTAAHCVDMSDSHGNAPIITAIIGQADISAYPANMVTVDKIVISSNYDSSIMYGDIALLHIMTPQYSTKVTLPYSYASSSELYIGAQMYVYGWGETHAGITAEYAEKTNYLQTTTLTLRIISLPATTARIPVSATAAAPCSTMAFNMVLPVLVLPLLVASVASKAGAVIPMSAITATGSVIRSHGLTVPMITTIPVAVAAGQSWR